VYLSELGPASLHIVTICYNQGCGVLIFCGIPTPGFTKLANAANRSRCRQRSLFIEDTVKPTFSCPGLSPWISGLIFVSRDFEVGRNVSCEESTVRLIYLGLFCVVLYFVTDTCFCVFMI